MAGPAFLVQKVAQLLASGRMAQLAQGLGLDLADAFARDVELLADLLRSASAAPAPRAGSAWTEPPQAARAAACRTLPPTAARPRRPE